MQLVRVYAIPGLSGLGSEDCRSLEGAARRGTCRIVCDKALPLHPSPPQHPSTTAAFAPTSTTIPTHNRRHHRQQPRAATSRQTVSERGKWFCVCVCVYLYFPFQFCRACLRHRRSRSPFSVSSLPLLPRLATGTNFSHSAFSSTNAASYSHLSSLLLTPSLPASLPPSFHLNR